MATAHLERVSKVARLIIGLDKDFPVRGDLVIVRSRVDCTKCGDMLVRTSGKEPGGAQHLACMACGVIVQSFFQKSL